MLKKTITYTDFNDVERTEDFYFNLTKAEVAEMEMSVDGGLIQQLERVVAAQDSKQIVAEMKSFIMKAYGEKSPDGRRFIKTPEVRDNFMQTEAYSQLFMEFSTDAEAAAAFVNGVIPSK